jgi:hypothetical protein
LRPVPHGRRQRPVPDQHHARLDRPDHADRLDQIVDAFLLDEPTHVRDVPRFRRSCGSVRDRHTRVVHPYLGRIGTEIDGPCSDGLGDGEDHRGPGECRTQIPSIAGAAYAARMRLYRHVPPMQRDDERDPELYGRAADEPSVATEVCVDDVWSNARQDGAQPRRTAGQPEPMKGAAAGRAIGERHDVRVVGDR